MVLLGWIASLLTVAGIFYAHAPIFGHDNAALAPSLHEMELAWRQFGVLDMDFSPFRCLGLPVFSNPNSIVWSIFQPLALLFGSSPFTVYAVCAIFVSVAFFGAFRLAVRLGLSVSSAVLMALGWSLQGFGVTHLVAGHASYLQFLLLPFFLDILMRATPGWIALGAVSFTWAHLLFTSGYYILIAALPSLVLGYAFLRWFLSEKQLEGSTWRSFLRNFFTAGFIAILMSGPKILGSLNFTALFPREAALERVGLWKGFVYTLSQYVWPFPWDIRAFTGWWYGNWESYEFFLPLVLFLLVWKLSRKGVDSVLRQRAAIAFGVLLVTGTLLSSGALAPIFSVLPIFKSLHVNPRWNGFVFLPAFVLVLVLLSRLGVKKFPPAWSLALSVAFIATPFFYLDRGEMQIMYTFNAGIAPDSTRLPYCYEPIFGYGLEQFPLGTQQHWITAPLADPRCYLKSNGCRPGVRFGEEGRDIEGAAKLERYELKDETPKVRWWKPFALALYLAGAACALYFAFMLIRESLGRR